jgi:tripartite-type tricarboxylate transporter receptor subunit TctC
MKKLVVILAAIFCSVAWSMAEAFPDKPITHIIPAKAGGGYDMSSRALTAGWEKILGQPITFDYAPGASGMIGFGKMMSKPSDGYTTIMTTISMQAISINIGESKWDWNQIGFIGNLITDPDVILVHKDAPWKTINDLIEYGKKANKPLTISTSHPKAISTLAAQVFIKMTGVNAKVVAFDGGAKARDALAGKQVDICIGPYFSASSKKDFIRALASFTKKKVWPGIWDIPTISEATGQEFPSMLESFAFLIKRDVAVRAPEAYKKLVDTFKEATNSKETREMAKKLNMDPFIDYWTPAECDAYVKEFQSVWKKYESLMQ